MPTILLVEDEYFIADDCASVLRKAGFDVAGPFAAPEEAASSLSAIDGALVDINLRGATAYPLIDELVQREIPVVIYTGYPDLPAKYEGLPRFQKPQGCESAVDYLRRAVNAAFESHSAEHPRGSRDRAGDAGPAQADSKAAIRSAP